MTKTSIFGQSESKQEDKKPIKFVKVLHGNGEIKYVKEYDAHKPNGWENVTLLEKEYANDLDLIWAYDVNPNRNGGLFLGHWNDGIVK